MPYGYPSGDQLRNSIVMTLLAPEQYVTSSLLKRMGHSNDDLRSFGDDFWHSQQPSIDAFLESRSDYLELGKNVIAAFLLEIERGSVLFKQEGYPELAWYHYLFQRMGPTIDHFRNSLKHVAIISFNYDVSLERFLSGVLKSAYGLDVGESIETLAQLPLVHVYGKLVHPPPISLRAGVPTTTESIEKASNGIKILRTDGETSDEFKRAHQMIRDAETVCFTGFGYDPTNLERLDIPGNFTKPKGMGRILGTAYEVDVDVFERTKQSLSYSFGPRDRDNIRASQSITLGNSDEDCLLFLQKHLVLG